jgi:two-component system sensor histidine kinase/response regulator
MLNLNLKYRLSHQSFQQLLRVFDELKNSEKALWIRDQVISNQVINFVSSDWAEFNLFLSENFNCLILNGDRSFVTNNAITKVDIALTLDTEEIAEFCQHLSRSSARSESDHLKINQAIHNLKANDAKLQSYFTLKILEIISNNPLEVYYDPSLTGENSSSSVWICQPIENALQQQIKQEQLLYRVTTQIRKSLELPVILSTAVEEVRRCLEVDRLLIYELHQNRENYHVSDRNLNSHTDEDNLVKLPNTSQSKSFAGCTTYESRSSEEIPSILEFDMPDDLVVHLDLNSIDVNQFPLVVDNITEAYQSQATLLQFMELALVKSELLLPIVVEDKLWGILIAHQCSKSRQWQETDRVFLADIAEHLAIAIRQALLYRQLQEQKQILEERFNNQTQDLRDALIAAESANRSKSEFLAAMSHELRTPLTCVIGMSSTLLRWSFGQLSEKQRHYLKTIHDSGEHLLELINDILELSQLEAGKAVLNLQEISLSQLAQTMLTKMQDKAHNQQIELKLDFKILLEDDLLIADWRRLKQILYNLLSNAIKFTPAGGQVILRVWREKQTIILQVEDTGVGISPEHSPQIFKKFQQLDSSYHRNYEGTGLGLALTKQLVELHGGWIDVSSEVGVGSIFTVQLPIKTNSHDQALLQVDQTKVKNNSLGGIVLIQEDETSASEFCDILNHAGYQVVWIVDSINALANIEVLEPKLVIIDTPLLDIDACEIIELLRELTQIEPVKILVLINNQVSEDLTRFWEAGADDYLIKPFKPQALFNKINAVFQLEGC